MKRLSELSTHRVLVTHISKSGQLSLNALKKHLCHYNAAAYLLAFYGTSIYTAIGQSGSKSIFADVSSIVEAADVTS